MVNKLVFLLLLSSYLFGIGRAIRQSRDYYSGKVLISAALGLQTVHDCDDCDETMMMMTMALICCDAVAAEKYDPEADDEDDDVAQVN